MDGSSDSDALRIELPEGAPPDPHAFVYDELGVVARVTGPTRALPELAPVVVWLGEALAAGLIGAAGERALTRVLARLCRRRDGDPPGEVEVVRGDRRPVVTFVFHVDLADDPTAVRDLLVFDVTRYTEDVRLHRTAGTWSPDPHVGPTD